MSDNDLMLDGPSISEVAETRPNQVAVEAVPLSSPSRGLPWIVAIFAASVVSYWLLRTVLNALAIGPTPLMSIGVSTIGAAVASAFALAAYKPFDKMASAVVRSAVITSVSLALSFAFWLLLAGPFDVDIVTYGFPIIATVWFWIAATSFVGGDAHLASVTPGRRTLLNVTLWVAGTVVVLAVAGWIPPFWFGFVQTMLVTGGFAYVLRRTTDLTTSLIAWAILIAMTATLIWAASALGYWSAGPGVGPWSIGQPTPEFGVFFAVWCGTNYGFLAVLQCWPFSRIRQPVGTSLAVVAAIAWAAAIAWVLVAIFDGVYADHATALLEAQVLGWQFVFWSFTFPLVWGAGSSPYRWVGQRTPGIWDDVE